ncbi:MAG: GGDEF domain-containing protein [bacterium]
MLIENTELVTMLHEILSTKAIRTVFQPIVHLTSGEVFGYEALSRGPVGSPFESPLALFSAASQLDMTWEVEYECLQLAITRFAAQDPKTLLFLNMSPTIVQDSRFYDGITTQQLSEVSLTSEQLVFEITEQVAVTNHTAFRNLLDHYRHQGFKLAIDDVGDGYAGLSLISKVNPHYLKLDIGLIKGIAHDPLRQHLVRSLASFATGMGMGIIAEGLENEDDLNCVSSLGIHYGQGYLLAYPNAETLPLDTAMSERLSAKGRCGMLLNPGIRLGAVCRTVPYLLPEIAVKDLCSEWHVNDTFAGKPIIQDGYPIGLIMRDSLFARLATPYGYSLYSHRNVTSVMESEPLILEQDISVETAALKALALPESRTYEHMIVTDQGRYLGMVTLKDLLSHMTTQSLARAHTANPLTGLPGNPIIHSELARVLATGLPFNLCYCDLDHFKTFNDAYGFTRGDAVIQSLATILQDLFGPQSETPAFIGHIGGDDFVIISDYPLPNTILEKVLLTFDANIPIYYDHDARERGSIESINRKGEVVQQPLCSLSIAVVTADNGPFSTPQSLTQRAAEVKHRCKALPGSCICYDQRRNNINPLDSIENYVNFTNEVNLPALV